MANDASGGELVTVNGASGAKKVNVFARMVIFLRQVIAELRKVVTPTRKELMKFVAVVLGFVLVMMALVYGLDSVFVWLTTNVFGIPG